MPDNLICIDFGFLTIYWYGVFIGMAVLLAALLFGALRKVQGAAWSDSLDTAMFALPAALIGARVFYCWFAKASFPNGLRDFLSLAEGGYALYGALLGVLTVLMIRAVHGKKEPFLPMADAAVFAVTAAIALGRFASRLCGGDIGSLPLSGIQSDSLPFVMWSESEQSFILWVGFWEGISALLTMLITGAVFAKTYGKKNTGFQKGDTLLSFMVMVGMTQTYWESMRNDSLFMVTLGFVRISQIISFVLALTALIVIIVKSSRLAKPRPVDVFLWVLCEAAAAAAVYCEFRMNALSVVRNYCIMGISLASMMMVALYFLYRNANRRVAAADVKVTLPEAVLPAPSAPVPSATVAVIALPPYVALRDRFRQTSNGAALAENDSHSSEDGSSDTPSLPLSPEEMLPIEIAEEPIMKP